MQKAIFALGCFWHPQQIFNEIKGVIKTTVGYTGGRTENPTYKEVCSKTTGHAEAIEIEFNETIVTFEELLNVFWTHHDPTQLNQQGPDSGDQYRSAIFYTNEKQKEQAEQSKQQEQQNHDKPIVTEITKLTTFYPAEDYHQNYLQSRQ